MANHYDKILKENIEEILIPLAEKLLQISIADAKELPDAIQITLEREPDVLKIIDDEYILQVEFQSTDEVGMVDRMYLYHALLWIKYHLPVKQYVIYIGDKTKLQMTESLVLENVDFRYQLINIQDFNYEIFLNSDKVEEVMMAILGNFHGVKSAQAIEQILDKIHKLIPKPLQFGKYAKQLEVLSNLRNLQSLIIKYLETMPIVYNLETDIRYQQGKGKGLEEGEMRRTIKSVKGLIRSKLLTNQQIAAIEEVSVEFVENLEKQILEENK
jgi:hypothetical protein